MFGKIKSGIGYYRGGGGKLNLGNLVFRCIHDIGAFVTCKDKKVNPRNIDGRIYFGKMIFFVWTGVILFGWQVTKE